MNVKMMLFRLQPVAMIVIDVVTPIVLMAFVGKLLGKYEIGLAFGFALGLFAYFRHLARGDVQPAVIRLFQKANEVKDQGSDQT